MMERKKEKSVSIFFPYKWCRYFVWWVRVRVGGSVRVRVNG